MINKRFPFVRQLDVMDCGAACLSMVCKSYGRTYPLQFLRQKVGIGKNGSSLTGLMKAAEGVGFKTFAASLKAEQLEKLPLPAIIHWDQVLQSSPQIYCLIPSFAATEAPNPLWS